MIQLDTDQTITTESIWCRDYYVPSVVWDNIVLCLANITTAKMVIDKCDYEGTSPIMIWLDTGAADIDDIDEGLAARLEQCVKDNTGNPNVHVRNHNSYAAAGSFDDDATYEAFYDFFAHGYPINYEKDYQSEGDPDNVYAVFD